MHLIGVKEENGWLISRWELTYPVGWDRIVRGVATVYGAYTSAEVLAGDQPLDIISKESLFIVPENRDMIIRGFNTLLNVPVMITFYNQLNKVDVYVAQSEDEFRNTDYEKFNHSMCQFMDSIELSMYH